MVTTLPVPADDASCGWFHLSKRRQPNSAHEGHRQARWAVVGAGLTGLAAARQLATRFPDDEVLLIEGQQVGFGPSGRNSGFVIDLPHDIGAPDYIGDIGTARLNLALNKAAQEILKRLISNHNIDCSLNFSGKYQAAIEDSGVSVLDSYRSGLDKLGEAYEVIEAKDIPAHLGTAFYRKALYTPGTMLLQPSALVKGLADSLPSNVTLYENTPITGFERGQEVELRHAKGSIKASNLLLTNNAFASHFGFLKRRLLPIFTYASITRPLTDDEQARIGGKDHWGIIPAHPFGTTLRRTPDNRILVRNSFSFNPRGQVNPGALAQSKRKHRLSFERRFPAIKDVEFEYTWGGAMCLSRNHTSYFGALDSNISAAVCCNGLGLTRGTITGTLLADWLAGDRNELIDFLIQSPVPAANPPEPFLSLGVNANLWNGERRAGLES
ncbi:FAD-dependent oxidoreductase [Pseudochelatococcus contaminans]|uniref:FAD-dependent oxidoreductase n=1 Tax=Pseudochelatococcus contaminans TaxID=1538103 RepID=UPI00160B61A5|nr:FAD-binding oxidoreductase [Pseudochelatococcus contaminans]